MLNFTQRLVSATSSIFTCTLVPVMSYPYIWDMIWIV